MCQAALCVPGALPEQATFGLVFAPAARTNTRLTSLVKALVSGNAPPSFVVLFVLPVHRVHDASSAAGTDEPQVVCRSDLQESLKRWFLDGDERTRRGRRSQPLVHAHSPGNLCTGSQES